MTREARRPAHKLNGASPPVSGRVVGYARVSTTGLTAEKQV
jgi:hypothetical protein